MGANPHYIVNISELYKLDEDIIGKKAYELGMLWKLGIPLPEGFIITDIFFKEFLHLTGIGKEIKKVRSSIHPSLADCADKLFHPVQKKIISQPIPHVLSVELHRFYRKISGTFKERPLNIFSSSIDRKYTEFRNVSGDSNLVLKIKTIWSSFLESPIAIIVQENIKADVEGKIFTDNPIIDKKLTETQMDKLLDYCKIIQNHFYFPKEIYYILVKNKLYITKINPFTDTASEISKTSAKPKVLIHGRSINPGIVTGVVKVLNNKYGTIEAKKGEIIVLPNLDRAIFNRIKNAKAVIIDTVSQNSLDKALYRKGFHVPTVEGAKNATRMFQNGNIITVNGVSGEIYSGGLIY